MKNIDELREKLAEAYEKTEKSHMKTTVAAELANIAGKMINSVKVQIEYHALRKEAPTIKFLESNKDKAA